MNEIDNRSFINSPELRMVFEIVTEKFLPHFEGEKKYEISINEECDHLGEYDDHNNTPKEKK